MKGLKTSNIAGAMTLRQIVMWTENRTLSQSNNGFWIYILKTYLKLVPFNLLYDVPKYMIEIEENHMRRKSAVGSTVKTFFVENDRFWMHML